MFWRIFFLSILWQHEKMIEKLWKKKLFIFAYCSTVILRIWKIYSVQTKIYCISFHRLCKNESFAESKIKSKTYCTFTLIHESLHTVSTVYQWTDCDCLFHLKWHDKRIENLFALMDLNSLNQLHNIDSDEQHFLSFYIPFRTDVIFLTIIWML